MEEVNYPELIGKAIEVRKNAYAPYSNFKVGAALLGATGKIYTGCNVENASFGGTICAERVAVVRAVTAGEREFRALAVVGHSEQSDAKPENYAFPCGICRQFLVEFCHADMPIVVARNIDDYRLSSLSALLPESFGPHNLE